MDLLKNQLNNKLFWVIFFGLCLRVFYFIFFADKVLGGSIYISGDTSGWTESFKNLYHFGEYTFDLSNKYAYFGRVPGYSFFWGVHYMIFGEALVYKAVAVSQLLLDTLCIYLIYKITHNLFNNFNSALIAASLYAIYPFSIIWITVSYSEIFSIFLNLMVFYFITKKVSVNNLIIAALISGLCFLTREFIALNLLSIFIALVLWKKMEFKEILKYGTLITLSFMLIYISWPIRNYINSGELIIARSGKAFNLYNIDFQAYRSWVTCWDNNELYWLDEMLSEDKVIFPKKVFTNKKEMELADSLVSLSRKCGSSFLIWSAIKTKSQIKECNNCNESIANGFNQLTKSYIKNNFLSYVTDVPLNNIKKSIFKNELIDGSSVKKRGRLINFAFGGRTICIVLGFIGILFLARKKEFYPLAAFIILLYFLFSFVIRYVETRNLLYADILLLIPCAFLIENISWKLGLTKR